MESVGSAERKSLADKSRLELVCEQGNLCVLDTITSTLGEPVEHCAALRSLRHSGKKKCTTVADTVISFYWKWEDFS